jgi:hypothetical protein
MDFMEIDIILGGYTSPKAANPSALLMVAFAPILLFSHPIPPKPQLAE